MQKLVLTAFLISLFFGLESRSGFAQTAPIADLKTFFQHGDSVDGKDVDLTATITFVEPIWNFVFVQEGGQAIFVHGVNTKGFELGDRVRIEGRGEVSTLSPILVAKRITRIESGVPPNPTPVKISELKPGDYDGRYVSCEGTVVRAVSSIGHILYFCEDDGVAFHVSIVGSQNATELWQMIGARIKIVGALAITLESGTEEVEPVLRSVEVFRLACMSQPEIISKTNNGPVPTEHTDAGSGPFFLEGHITASIDDYFVMSDSESARKIQFPNAHAFGMGNIVCVVGTSEVDGQNNQVLNALVVESRFSMDLPWPPQFHEIEPADRMWKYVAVSGQPTNIREEGEGVRFDIFQGDQLAKVELLKGAYTSIELLENTKRVEVTGVVTKCDASGDCDVVVNNSRHVDLVEAVVPIWKYVAWILLPLTTLFSIGFVWVKTQRARDAARAASIREMHTRLVSTYQAINDGLLAVDNDNRVLTVNAKFCDLLAIELKDGEKFIQAKCQSFLDRIKESNSVERMFFNSDLSIQDTSPIEIEVLAPELGSYDLSLTNIVGDDQLNIGRLFILQDRTSERELQAELIHMNKSEAVGELASGIAHDFNNILTTITANLSIISKDADLAPDVLAQVTDAELAADRGADLVKRMLTYSGKCTLEPKTHSINTIIRELHKFARATFDARYKFIFDLDESEPSVFVDPGSVEQVILNLYLNSRDALPDGGTIHTKTRLENFQDGERVCVWIADDGLGVPAKIRDQVFEPFFTTKADRSGRGLGLSTSKRLMNEQNGQLAYLPTAEPGSCFLLALPLCKSNRTAGQIEKDSADRRSAKIEKTILLVDDEDSILKVATMILSKHGYDVTTTESGEAAVTLLESKGQDFDLVVSDLTMPGISGLELFQIATQEYPGLPFVLCSGYLADITDGIPGDCLTLSKPFSASQLVTVVAQALQHDAVTSDG